jgi:toluene monooxygenase system ferredoxin subunit
VSLVEVLPESELWVGEMRSVRLGMRRLLLLRTERGVCAYEDRCPHLGVPLSRGTFVQNTLTCSAHHFQFDADTGSGMNPKNVRLEAARVECRGGKILIDDGLSEHGVEAAAGAGRAEEP